MLSRFHLIPERNGQTDGRTERQICYINIARQKNDVTFWLMFGLSPNLGLSESLSERLIQKVKRRNEF